MVDLPPIIQPITQIQISQYYHMHPEQATSEVISGVISIHLFLDFDCMLSRPHSLKVAL